jgi:hypothetical protein
MKDLKNNWRHYAEGSFPPAGAFLAFVASEARTYVAMNNLSWTVPHFWNGEAWVPIKSTIVAWQPMPGNPEFQ